MAPQTYETTPTRFVEANGIHYAYRSFGKESGAPLVFLQHFPCRSAAMPYQHLARRQP